MDERDGLRLQVQTPSVADLLQLFRNLVGGCENVPRPRAHHAGNGELRCCDHSDHKVKGAEFPRPLLG